MARLFIVLHSSGNKMHWQMPSPRAVVNTDLYELLYLVRDVVGSSGGNMVRGAPLESDMTPDLYGFNSHLLKPCLLSNLFSCPLPTHTNQKPVSNPQVRGWG